VSEEKKECSGQKGCGDSDATGDATFEDKVAEALGDIRPLLQRDGGDIELVEAKDGIVRVKLTGACGGCPMAQITLKRGVEAHLKKVIPEVEAVESV